MFTFNTCQRLRNVLLAMADVHFNTKLFVQMFSQMLSRIYATMLTTCTPKREHERGEATFYITLQMGIS